MRGISCILLFKYLSSSISIFVQCNLFRCFFDPWYRPSGENCLRIIDRHSLQHGDIALLVGYRDVIQDGKLSGDYKS